jgi:hypothetical protein
VQVKNGENFCLFLQIFDNQFDIFHQRKPFSARFCLCNRFFAIFAPSLTNIFSL